MTTKCYALIACLLCIAACDRSGGGAETTGSPTAPPAATAQAAEIGAWGIDFSARDEGVRPGNDFNRYRMAAGSTTFEIPADLSAYGTFVRLRLEAEEDVRAIVEDLSAGNPAAGTVEQQVGDVYAAWMDEEQARELGITPLQPYLAEIAAIETKTDLMNAFANLHLIAPFTVSIIPDPADTTRYAPCSTRAVSVCRIAITT